MKIKLIYVIYFVISLFMAGTATYITTKVVRKTVSAAKEIEFSKIVAMYEKQLKTDMEVTERWATAYETLASKSRYTISNTYSVKKNKNGEMYFIPTSTMEIDKVLEEIDQKIKAPIDTVYVNPVDSLVVQPVVKKTFWEKIQFWNN